jgi:hypothetical protein
MISSDFRYVVSFSGVWIQSSGLIPEAISSFHLGIQAARSRRRIDADVPIKKLHALRQRCVASEISYCPLQTDCSSQGVLAALTLWGLGAFCVRDLQGRESNYGVSVRPRHGLWLDWSDLKIEHGTNKLGLKEMRLKILPDKAGQDLIELVGTAIMS